MVAAVQLAIIVGRAHSGDPVAQFQTAQAAAQIYQAVDAFRQAPVISTVAAAAALRAKLDAEFAEYERLAAEGRHFEAGMALRTAGATLIEISTLGVGTGARVARTAGNVAEGALDAASLQRAVDNLGEVLVRPTPDELNALRLGTDEFRNTARIIDEGVFDAKPTQRGHLIEENLAQTEFSDLTRLDDLVDDATGKPLGRFETFDFFDSAANEMISLKRWIREEQHGLEG